MKKVLLKTILNVVAVLFFVLPTGSKASSGPADSLLMSVFKKGINYLAYSQIKTLHSDNSYIGEWPTFIYNTEFIPFLGKKGKSAYDSNVFNTLFIHNMLAEFYLTFRKDTQVISVLKLAQKNIEVYRNETSFNFWPLLDRPQELKCRHPGCRQRRALNFDYHYGFINNYANIFDDADDTAAGLLAYFYSEKLKTLTGDSAFTLYNTSAFLNNFKTYRDTGRRKSNWYNKRIGFNYRTGAYLTWFGPDRKHSNFFSWFFPSHKNQNILYGRNEVDCVVNANILRTLYLTGDTLVDGISESKTFLKEVINKKVCFTCGVYYPTEFTFHYAIARAISSGVGGFEDQKQILINTILSKRNKSGYWESQIGGNDVQASLYALNALMLLSEGNALKYDLEPTIDYLLENMVTEGDMVHWNAGVFFSGGSAIRYIHVWKSEAYTTALALEAIANYYNLKKQA
jgi:hypothetical protein